MKHSIETKIIEKQYRALFPIQALAMGIPAINTLICCCIAGNFYGESALAAIGFINPLNVCITAIGGILGTGGQIVCGNSLGRGDQKGLNSAYSTVLSSALLIGLAFSVIMLAIPESLAKLLGASGDVLTSTNDYIRGMGVGAVFTLFSSILIIFLQMEQMRITSVICTALSVAVSVGGNLANAFLLHWGIFGASFFVSVGNAASAILALIVLFTRGRVFRFSPGMIRAGMLGQVARAGFPYAADFLAWIIGGLLINRYAFELGGTVALSALTVANNISAAVGRVIAAGNDGSAFTIASVLVGERDISSLRDLPKVMVKISLPFFLTAYLLVFVFAGQLALFLGAEPENLDIYVSTIRLLNLWYLPNCLVMPAFCIYQSMGKIWQISLLGILDGAVIPAFSCIVLTRLFGFNAVSSILPIGQVMILILFAAVFVIKAHRLPRSPLELCYIPSTISAPRENRFKAVISTVDEALTASESMVAFCRERGLSEKTAYYTGLCIEEIAVDTILNRFSDHHSEIDLRAVCEDGQLSILLRDDCDRFDPRAWLDLCTPEDESRSIGIRLVMGLAKEVSSIHTLRMNVLKLSF